MRSRNVLSSSRLVIAILSTLALPTFTAIAAPSSQSVSQPTAKVVNQRQLGDGLYELAVIPQKNALFIASAQSFKGVNGGVIYRLDPNTLATTGETHTDLKNFGMTADEDGKFIYTTNSLDGAVSKIDAQDGKVLQRLFFKGKDKDGDPVGAREILLHDRQLYIGRVTDPGYISIVDAQTMTLKGQIEHVGKWVTGIIYSPLTQRIYAASGSGEIAVINPHNNKIEQRWKPDDGRKYLFLNMAEDPSTGHLFVTDNSEAKTTLVFDEHTGKVIKRLAGDALGIKFNAQRHEIYISQRESKKVLQLDAVSLAEKHAWSFTDNPNSLFVSADGKTLYVTLKQEFNADNSTKGPDSIARIALD